MKLSLTIHPTLAALMLFTALLPVTSVQKTQAAPAPITVSTKMNYMQEWDDTLGKYLCEYRFPEIRVSVDQEQDYPGLSQAFESWNEERENGIREAYAAALEDAKVMSNDNPEYFMTFADTRDFLMQRSDSTVVSILEPFSWYGGGVHGSSGYYSHNFDPETGARLRLTDVVTDIDGIERLAEEALKNKYPEMDWSYEREIFYHENDEDPCIWTLSGRGISFWFGSYAIASYAEGMQNVMIPFEGNETLFNEKYLDVPDSWTMEFPVWDTASVDVNGDGTPEKVSFWAERYDEYSYDKVQIQVNSVTTGIDTWCYDLDGTFVFADGRTFLYLFMLSDNDYTYLDVFDLSSGTAVRVLETGLGRHFEQRPDGEWGYTQKLTDPDNFILDTRYDILSTSTVCRRYHVGNGGAPEPREPFFHFGFPRTLTVKETFSAVSIDETGNESGSVSVPAGSVLSFYRTDNETWTDMVLENGSIVRITADSDSWPRLVDGRDIEELFDGVMFAG